MRTSSFFLARDYSIMLQQYSHAAQSQTKLTWKRREKKKIVLEEIPDPENKEKSVQRCVFLLLMQIPMRKMQEVRAFNNS